MGLTFKKLGVSFFGLVSFSLTKHFDPIVRLFICLPGFIYGAKFMYECFKTITTTAVP